MSGIHSLNSIFRDCNTCFPGITSMWYLSIYIYISDIIFCKGNVWRWPFWCFVDFLLFYCDHSFWLAYTTPALRNYEKPSMVQVPIFSGTPNLLVKKGAKTWNGCCQIKNFDNTFKKSLRRKCSKQQVYFK